MREYTPEQRRDIITLALRGDSRYGLVVIDGVRDLLRDINNPSEALDIINDLMRWSSVRGNYKVYEDEALNARILQPQIKGNCLIATIDKVPCTIALPDKVVDAYNHGALPLNTLANAVLAKNGQMRHIAAENYAASEQQAQTRTLAQR